MIQTGQGKRPTSLSVSLLSVTIDYLLFSGLFGGKRDPVVSHFTKGKKKEKKKKRDSP